MAEFVWPDYREAIAIETQDGHLVTRRVYDETLQFVGSMTQPAPGFQLNGHRADCRCETCRPDIWRLPEPQDRTEE